MLLVCHFPGDRWQALRTVLAAFFVPAHHVNKMPDAAAQFGVPQAVDDSPLPARDRNVLRTTGHAATSLVTVSGPVGRS